MEEINKTGIYRKRAGKKILYFTKSIYPGFRGFEETIIKLQGQEYREIRPERSKLVAGIAKGLSQTGIKKDSTILYLGASHGYTPSFLSDIAEQGFLFCLDFAPRVVKDLVFVCEQRKNMAPLLESASQPENYKELIPEVDVVYQDLAQRNQVEIFLENCDLFLKKQGFGILAVKARSIDVTKKPKDIFRDIRFALENSKSGVSIVDYKELDPYEKDHALFVVKKK